MSNVLLLTWFTVDLSPARVLCMKHMKVDLKFPTIWNISLSILLQKIPANCVNLSFPEHRMMQFWLDIYFISDGNDLGLLFLFESVKTPVYWNWELHRLLKAIPIVPKKLQVQSNTYQYYQYICIYFCMCIHTCTHTYMWRKAISIISSL